MSLINLYLKERGAVKEIAETPLFMAQDLLTENFREEDMKVLGFRAKAAQSITSFDLGVMFIDFDTKTVFSAQRGFGLNDLNKKDLFDEWKFEELGSCEAVAKRVGMKTVE